MAELLITGGAGFIGANFVRQWRQGHPDDVVIVLDALTYAGNRASLAGVADIEFIHGDIRDFGLVQGLLKERGISTVVNFAAETHVDRSIRGPDTFVETNVMGTLSLLQAARAAWLDSGSGKPHRFHHISTDEVFGSLAPDVPGATEQAPYQPNSPYAASKAASDHLVRAWHNTYGLETTVSHCSNNYGPYQFPEKLIPFFLVNLLTGQKLPLYGDGQHRRDWLHVEDHCRGIELVLAKGRPGESYNLGGGQEMTNQAVADRLCAAVDAVFAQRPELAGRFADAPPAKGAACAELKAQVPDRKGHDRRYALDDRKARAELGYAPLHDFSGGLEQTIAWYLDNEPWWQAVRDGRYQAWLKANYTL